MAKFWTKLRRRRREAYVVCFLCALVFFVRSLVRPNDPNRELLAGSFWERWPLSDNEDGIDWHNFEQIEEEAKRTGDGEQGVRLKMEDSPEKEAAYKVNGFNALASDKIALDRALPDIRHKGCKDLRYHKHLPTASVVVPFHNEHLTTLLRTAVSVINRSPPDLIKEVILVDDFSSKDIVKKPLDDYVAEHLPKVRVIRLEKRSGLILARLAGAREATGDVIIFLDSHSEANVNWLPPLLDPIAEDKRTVVCPFIDVIDYDNFEYRAQDEGARGAFDWEFFYKRLPVLPEDEKNMPKPFASPVMAGGLFAISAEWFWELGGYDPGLQIWGGEQYELSFKIWQCGGRMVDAPCSRIGHIYRKFAPFPNPGIGDFVGKNYRRVAVVWMDEYAEFLYRRRPHYRSIDPGDVSEQRAVRDRLQCKPFKWFMEFVAFDLPEKYPPIEPPDFAEGEIRSIASSNLCVDTRFKQSGERFGLEKCMLDNPQGGGEQQFSLTYHKDIRPKKRTVCWDVSSSDARAPVLLWSCHGSGGNQLWKYDEERKQIIHGHNYRCLDHNPGAKELFAARCDPEALTQRWNISIVRSDLIKKYWENPKQELKDLADGVLDHLQKDSKK